MTMTNQTHASLAKTIEEAWENRANITVQSASSALRDAVQAVVSELDAGQLRVAEKQNGNWVVHQWIKKAVLLSFRLADNKAIQSGALQFFDKVPTKFEGLSQSELTAMGVRVVPPAVARRGAFIARNVVLMPSYVNIGAYVDEGTMVDTWATV